MDDTRKKELMQAANRYSDIAVKEQNTAKASREFLSDYMDGMWSFDEHILLMMLVQKYINCKCKVISRQECTVAQDKIFADFEQIGCVDSA